MHEAHFALASERARIVEALSVLAQTGVVGTLVDVLAGVAVAFEAGVAFALEGTVVVEATGVLVAAPVVGHALVHVPAADAVACETVLANALVRPLSF